MNTDFDTFFSWLVTRGLEHFRLYYGCYRGVVTDNADPESRGRIKAVVQSVGQTTAVDVWIDPSFPGAGHGKGMFWPPEPGDSVRVMFEAGDPSRPILYFGGWFGKSEVPSNLGYNDGVPERRGFTTRAGHSLTFDDTPGSEAITIKWNQPSSQPAKRSDVAATGKTASIKVDNTGSITLTSQDGGSIKMDSTGKTVTIRDSNGNQIQTSSAGIEIKEAGGLVLIANGADTFAVRGTDLLAYLAGHQHPTAVGLSAPPATPPPPTILSTKVMLK